MSCCCFIAPVLVLFVLAFILKKIYSWLNDYPDVPYVDEGLWWGPEDRKTGEDADKSIKPFKINVSDKDLDDLKERLSKTRPFTPPLEGIQHEYGINTNLLKEILEYWQTKYNWRERETFLNQFPQFTTKIQGLNIHFLHVKPAETNGQKVVPLLLLHGWPGSVREFYEAIPKLTKPNPGRNFVFEVIAPHLPGYGFSDGTVRTGLNPTRIAVIFKKLMERLQFDKWYVQGGDWGSIVATDMTILFPSKVLGIHVNMVADQPPKALVKKILGSLWPSMVVSEKHRPKLYPMKNAFFGLLRETGYFHIQATRPDTVGVALNQSPIGLAAYIIEKFIVWTNLTYLTQHDGGLLLKYNYDKLLDNIMIYWITNSITTSVRIYAEAFDSKNQFKVITNIPIEVPSAVAQFGNDFLHVPETLAKEKFKALLQYSDLPTGGHFAAFEEPEMFADDVWNAVEKFENHYKK